MQRINDMEMVGRSNWFIFIYFIGTLDGVIWLDENLAHPEVNSLEVVKCKKSQIKHE
jgi:hypothetical protein